MSFTPRNILGCDNPFGSAKNSGAPPVKDVDSSRQQVDRLIDAIAPFDSRIDPQYPLYNVKKC
jgi:hypothetical protein